MIIHDKKLTQLHFVGIGGIGMSGIAEVFFNQGYKVSGSDLQQSDTTKRLQSLGVRIDLGHQAKNVQGASVVVISSAVKSDNPEVMEAKRLRVPVIPRAEMLGELMRGKVGIAVAGTHGKTTTTSMLASILTTAGLDPTIVIGGKVDALGGNAKLGQGQLVVAEADESDGSFLHLPATFGIITNIDNDHLDHFGSLDAIESSFVEFVNQLPFYGLAAVCADDPIVKKCLPRFTKPVVTYGFSKENDYYAQNVKVAGIGSSFELFRHGEELLGSIELGVPGRHNVLNSVAAAAIVLRIGEPFESIRAGLMSYAGVRRRFDIRWKNESTQQLIVDDYGHHPTEVLATLAAAKSYWPGRIVTVFQPHRYSRTLHCRDLFAGAFQDSDVVLLTDIYAAGEEPITGVSAKALAEMMQKNCAQGKQIIYVGDLEEAKKKILTDFRTGDLVLCMGAGSITRLPDQLIEHLGLKSDEVV